MTAAAALTSVVTDVELDGPSPLRNSMLSFATVAIDGAGSVLDEFQVVLEPLADRSPDPAIDDACGSAHVLSRLLALAAGRTTESALP